MARLTTVCAHLLWRSCWLFALCLPIRLPEAAGANGGQGHDGLCIVLVPTNARTFKARSKRLAERFGRPRADLIFSLNESGIVQHIDTPANVAYKTGQSLAFAFGTDFLALISQVGQSLYRTVL